MEKEAGKLKVRAQYALRNGLGYGLFIFIVMGLFKLRSHPIGTVFFSVQGLRDLGLCLLGGFLGFFFLGWWAKKDQDRQQF